MAIIWDDPQSATSGPCPTDNAGLLTADEHEAIRLLGKVANLLARSIIADGPTRGHDTDEAFFHVHALQRMVGSQAAARAYPDQFRLLGSTIPLAPDAEFGQLTAPDVEPEPA